LDHPDHNKKAMKKRRIRVMALEDFMCRCGATDFDIHREAEKPIRMTCNNCGRSFAVSELSKKTHISNLPMSFGFRSLYWDKFEMSEQGLVGVSEEGYEIKEIKQEES
jgi:hypothetical protein